MSAPRHSTRVVLRFCILHSDFCPLAASLGQSALTISNPIESGCITNSVRTHARKSADFEVCSGWDLTLSILRTTTLLAACTSIAP